MHNTDPVKIRQREPVLIVINPDGFVEVFGDRIDARIVNRVTVSTVEGEIKADEVIERLLPERHLKIFYPGSRRAIGNLERIKPADLLQRKVESEICKIADRLAEREVVSCLV